MYPATLERLRCVSCDCEKPLAEERVLAEADDGELVDAILRCGGCARWYRVESGVADLVRDGLRDTVAEQRFLDAHGLGGELSPGGGHWEAERVTDEDRKIIAEGHHWGRYLRHFYEAGDRCILDPRARGTFPRFYVAGLLERDDRDSWRKWGFYSPPAAKILFDDLASFAGQAALELGCGGGQYGLEAARQGVRTISIDPSHEELSIGRKNAREIGIREIEFVRAESATPPVFQRSVDLLLAKDSLHHVPELERVFPRMIGVLKDTGTMIVHEHVASGRMRDWINSAVREPSIRKMRRRYPAVEIPQDLLRDSANEDVSAEVIPELMERYFQCETKRYDLYLALDLESYVYFAFGKRAWFAKAWYPFFWLLEKSLMLVGEKQHYTFRGRKKS